MDFIDKKILNIMAQDGRISVTELGRRINLSKAPTLHRLKRLETDGYILGYQAVLNLDKLGRVHIAFTEVKLNDTSEHALSAFNAAVRNIPEIEQCHMIAGAFDYLLKVRTSSIIDYRRILGEDISKLPHVANTSSHVSMESVIEK